MKMAAMALIGCLATFQTSSGIAQQPTMTQLVPGSASHALVFRNVNELKERGDELAGELGHPSGFSMLFFLVRSQFLPSGVADDVLPCGIMWFEPELIGEPVVKQSWKKPVAVGVAISDTKKLAEYLNIDHEEFVSGKTVKQDHSAFGHKHRFYRMVDRYLWVVSHERLYELLEQAKPLAHAIPRSRLESIDSADLLISLSARSRELNREGSQKQAERWIKSMDDLDAAEEYAIRELSDILSWTSYGIFTARIDRGVELSFNMFFDDVASPDLRERILQLSPPADGVTLAGLPSGDLLFGHAARTDAAGIQPALTATVRANRGIWWRGWRPMQDWKFVSQLEQLKLLGLFAEIWPLTNRYKVGLYREENPTAHGLVSMAAVLDTDSPDRLIRELQILAALVDRTALGSGDNSDDQEKTQALVRKLISQLSVENFEQRQSATTRLVLIGEPALPLIAEARRSKLPEVAKRATQIEKLIQEELKEKRGAALESSVLAKAKPVFIFRPDAEERAGASVHIMEVRINEKSELNSLLPVLAGPEWSRIRFVRFDRHVAVFFGSNLEQLDQMIRNVQAIEQGDEVPVPEIPYGTPLLDMRGAEFQGSIARVARLMNGQRLTEKERDDLDDPELSSASVTIEPEFFGMELRLSLPDLKVIRKQAF